MAQTRQSRYELTYEPDIGGYEAGPTIDRVGEILGGRAARNDFGQCLVIDRRYESDRWHGDVRIAECEIGDAEQSGRPRSQPLDARTALPGARWRSLAPRAHASSSISKPPASVAAPAPWPFSSGCGFYDLGAFQVRQFLLTSYAAERALLTAVAEFFDDAELIVSYNGKTFDVPVMETRWLFHRMAMPLDGVPHFDTLHTARRLWKRAPDDADRAAAAACRRSSARCSTCGASATCLDSRFPSRFFQFMRTGDPRPLEPVLEHNRLDLGLAGRASRRAPCGSSKRGADGCPDGPQALGGGPHLRARRARRARGSLLSPRVDVRRARGAGGSPVSSGPALPARAPVRRGGRPSGARSSR